MEVIHEAPKCFWKWRCTLDVCIVQHTGFDVAEVIAYEPSIARESSRIFVDCSALALMVSEADVEERAKILKEPSLRRKEAPDVTRLKLQAHNDAKAELVMNRLQIEEFSLESKSLQMTLVPTFCDLEKGRPKLICAKPPGLRNYQWAHTSTCTSKDIARNLDVLDNQLTGAKKDTVAAAKFEQTARSALSVRERWRVALVFGKVAKGRRLSVKDSKIWDIVAQKLQCPDVEENTTGVHVAPRANYPTDERTICQHGHNTPQSRRGSDPAREHHKPHPSPKLMTPREAVEHQTQGLTPRSYSVTGGQLHHAPSDSGGRMDGIADSLERSVGCVAGASMDTRNKQYRIAASVDSGTDYDEPTVRMHSFHSRPVSPSPSHPGPHERTTGTQRRNLSVDTNLASHAPSRPQSAASSPYHGRSMRAHSPISRIPDYDAPDAPPAMKRKHSKQAAFMSVPSACDLANKQLTATRMLKSLARAGAAVRNSIRASFADDSAKVFADAGPAAETAEFQADECNAPLRSTQKPGLHAEAGAGASVSASVGSGGVARPSGGFGGGFLSVDVICSMVRKMKNKTADAKDSAVRKS